MFEYSLNFENQKSLMESIEFLANKIAKNGLLEVNENKYRIIDFEFYLHTKSEFAQDPHTYNNGLQRQKGKLYDHASGIDLTFGDKENAVGILIRGLAKLDLDQPIGSSRGFISSYFDGPHKARTEIIGNFKFNQNNTLKFTEVSTKQGELFNSDIIKVIVTKRVNLTPKASDEIGKFLQEPLRYIALVPKYNFVNNKFISNGSPIKISGIESLVKEAIRNRKITIEEGQMIVGYRIKLD